MGLGGRSPEVTDLGGRFHHSMSMEPSKRGGQAGSLGPRGCWATRSSRSVLFLFKGTSAWQVPQKLDSYSEMGHNRNI